MIREILPPETGLAFEAMRELRRHLRDEPEFVLVNEIQRSEGYRLIGTFDDESRIAIAVAGFRLGNGLSWGRFLYVDDLSTLPRLGNEVMANGCFNGYSMKRAESDATSSTSTLESASTGWMPIVCTSTRDCESPPTISLGCSTDPTSPDREALVEGRRRECGCSSDCNEACAAPG
jgi:hypothetical protein